MQTDERLPQLTAVEKPPWYRDVRVLRVIIQVFIVGGVVAIAAFFIGNMITNMQRLGISLGLDYLTQPAEFTIPGSDFERTGSRLEAVLVGVGMPTAKKDNLNKNIKRGRRKPTPMVTFSRFEVKTRP